MFTVFYKRNWLGWIWWIDGFFVGLCKVYWMDFNKTCWYHGGRDMQEPILVKIAGATIGH